MTEVERPADEPPRPVKRTRRPRQPKPPAGPPRVVRIWRELDGDEDLVDVVRSTPVEPPLFERAWYAG